MDNTNVGTTLTSQQIEAYFKGIEGLGLSTALIAAGINAIVKATK